jgi:transposase InsO family protein
MAKYAFMLDTETTEPGRFPVTKMSDWLEVSRSGYYYDWKKREPSARAQRREEIAALVQWSFDRSNATYGHRRIHADLTRQGIAVGLDLVRELMAEHGLVACQPRPWRTTTISGDLDGPADLVERDFTADRPGVKLGGDITYIDTWAGFAYLATVIDCHHKGVIGWAVADHMRTNLVTEALAMADRNHDLQPDCIFHSDRGAQGGFNRSSQHLEQEVRDEVSAAEDAGQGARRSDGGAARCAAAAGCGSSAAPGDAVPG